MCSGQTLTTKIRDYKIIENFAIMMISIIIHKKKLHYLMQNWHNLLSDQGTCTLHTPHMLVHARIEFNNLANQLKFSSPN